LVTSRHCKKSWIRRRPFHPTTYIALLLNDETEQENVKDHGPKKNKLAQHRGEESEKVQKVNPCCGLFSNTKKSQISIGGWWGKVHGLTERETD